MHSYHQQLYSIDTYAVVETKRLIFSGLRMYGGESRAITTNTTRLIICDIPQHIMNVRGLSLINSPNPAMTETASRDKKIALANHREPENGHNRY